MDKVIFVDDLIAYTFVGVSHFRWKMLHVHFKSVKPMCGLKYPVSINMDEADNVQLCSAVHP